MQTIQWEVRVVSPPPVLRHCKQCRKTVDYHSSGLFRVNAQKKSLDIWLIYKCAQCQSTWNMTVHSRISPQALDARTLERFCNNDAALALQCACDASLLRKNGAAFCQPHYHVLGEPLPQTPVMLHLTSSHPCAVRVSALLRDRLGLSHRQFGQLIENGQLCADDGCDLKKARLNRDILLRVTLGDCVSLQNTAS